MDLSPLESKAFALYYRGPSLFHLLQAMVGKLPTLLSRIDVAKHASYVNILVR